MVQILIGLPKKILNRIDLIREEKDYSRSDVIYDALVFFFDALDAELAEEAEEEEVAVEEEGVEEA